jgi:hypothetical protein
VAPGAAREYVRVALALVTLPLLDGAFAAGRLSYSKIRALTRVADRIDEQTLLEQGLVHTASQLERTSGVTARPRDRALTSSDVVAPAGSSMTTACW